MPRTVLTREEAVEARELYKKHVPQWKIAERFGVTRGAISELVRGNTWGFKNISRGKAKGEDSGRAKLTEIDVKAIRILHAHGFTPTYMRSRFGITSTQIHCIVTGKKWAHVAPIPTP